MPFNSEICPLIKEYTLNYKVRGIGLFGSLTLEASSVHMKVLVHACRVLINLDACMYQRY